MEKRSAMPWWGWAAGGLAWALGITAYFHLPPRTGVHAVPRFLVVAYEPGIITLVLALWQVLWRVDPRRRDYGDFWPTYRMIGGVIVACIGLAYLATLGHLLGWVSLRLIPTSIGLMFLLIANVLPRTRPNWWVGFRTPWTLSSEECWIRTHRLAGQLGIPVGGLIMALAWILPGRWVRLAVPVPLAAWVAATVVASYFFASAGKDA